MSRKRILFCISNENEILSASSFAKAIKEYFKDVETVALYVKDIKKYELFQGDISSFAIPINEYREIEGEIYKTLKTKLDNSFDMVYELSGDKYEVISEEMKAYDLLVVVKDEGELTPLVTKIIRTFYKPFVLLNEKTTEYSFEKVLMLNDGGYMVNKSVFSYFNLFGEHNIDVLRVNVEDRNRLTERFGNICNIIDEKGNNIANIIEKYLTNYDIVLMGGLNYPIFLERLTGQTGIKVIETSEKPIFIG
ncbi:GntR family transcriptional regulator [Oceanivirga miroungae]|uniref:UspA domain-containing protein n=1 Tax=Oceanivirga miroungae TaxID=1130046 RepID=A0A6I8M8Y8_9FUSO|nr:GntR family transcriptional regulator [Oceanivirga miroungae]VWL85969.1 hypothetical protein OMES3154_01263 [Oceanivirga miroungae]